MEGIIKKIIIPREFGFILDPITHEEYFFHRDDFTGHWPDLISDHEGDKGHIKVSFEKRDSPKGPRASNIRRLDFPN